jgi:DNA polymerase-3 subunit delta
MTKSKPTVYVLRGDDRQAIETHLSKFFRELGTPDMAEMNTSRLEGGHTSLNDLREAALALPFLADRRLVILEDALKMLKNKGQQERKAFLELLDSLPQSTALTLVIPDTRKYSRGQTYWETLNGRHWLIQWIEDAGEKAYVIDCPLPDEREMPSWVRAKAKELNGSFTTPAAMVLAEYVGNNTQRAIQEIEKLLTYVNLERPVDDDDVRRLTAQDQQGDIFALVDAIGNRNGQQALEMLHILLDESDPLQLYGMIIRQFRLLLQTREIIEMGGQAQDVAKRLKQHPYVAGKITQQARHFDLTDLEQIYHRLLKIDLDMKTGGMPGDVALDVLIAELAQ